MILLMKKENYFNMYYGNITYEMDSFLFCKLFHTYIRKNKNKLYIMFLYFIPVGILRINSNNEVLSVSFKRLNPFKSEVYRYTKKYIGEIIKFN